METTNASDGEEGETSVSIARGGPIYVPNLVGPLTGVPQFESTLLYEIQDLKAELCLDSSSPPDEDDLSIDELKVFADEELVEMALNNTPKDQSKNVSSSQSSEEQLNARTGIGEDSSAALEPLNGGTCCGGTIGTIKSRRRKRYLKQSDGSHTGNNCNTAIITNNSRKGKGSKANKYSIDESCRAKVDELLKIKQKQDQDRAAARLHSLKYLSNCKDSKVGSISLERSEGMTYLKSTKSAKQQSKPSNIEEHIAVQNPEVVLCIEVYHNVRNWIKTQEFLVLGRQTLTELRDKIYCMTDQVMQKAGKHDPSGYFLIEDVFCNDMRDPSAMDYSEPIFDWLRNSKDDALRKWECIISGELQRKQKAVVGESTTSQLPQFRRADMQKVRFCDLRFRLGTGYLYCHQGDCKHTIVIRDMRLVHPDDVQNRAAYPIVIFQHKPRFQKCNICKIFRATKLTVDDKWTPCNPCYFCNDCYYLLHYSENGSLLYSDFSTFDYLHD